MSFLPLSNGRLLMPILALFLMNVPVAEAKLELPEGTMGNYAKIGLVIISIIVGSGIFGTLVYLFRTLFGIPHDSHTETDRRLCGSKKRLQYIRWIAGQNPATHPIDEGVAVRVPDLENQLLEEPPPTRALPVRFFKCLIRTAKSCYTSVIGSGNSTNENSRLSKGKAPEERDIFQHPPIPIAAEKGLEIGVHHAIYPATAAYPSRKVTAAHQSGKSAHRHTSAKTFRAPGEIGIHYSSYKPRGASVKYQHDVISPPPQAYIVATSTKHADNPVGPAAASSSHHAHLGPYKPGTCRYPVFPIASSSITDLSNTWSCKPVSPSAASSILISFGTKCRYPVPSAASSILNSSGTICRYSVFPSASSSIADLSGNESCNPVFPPESSSILNSSGTICRYSVFTSASSGVLNSSDTIFQYSDFPSATSSVLNFSGTMCHKPVFTLASSSILSVSDAICCKPVSHT